MTAQNLILFIYFPIIFFGFPGPIFGQRVTISTWSGSDEITVRSLGMVGNSLSFNQHSDVITPNSGPIHIRKEDNNTVIFAIEAPSEFEIVINMDYNPYLIREGGSFKENSIPIVFYMAYNNQNAADEIVAKNESIDLMGGVTSIKIPVNRNLDTNLSSSVLKNGMHTEKPKSVVYLFVFGTLGPIGSVPAGDYGTQISINVNVADETN